MYIDNIRSFLPKYSNIERTVFLDMLRFINVQQFNNFKIEKDFLLTLILIRFSDIFPDLIFKGGTCLNKVYFPYFRLSEDLDFVLSQELGRTARQTFLKKYESGITQELQKLGLTQKEGRTKFDEHRLALLTYQYNSVIDNSPQTIKIDISLKGKLKLAPYQGMIQSIYKDSVFEEALFGEHTIFCIDLQESLAEKIRAALTRKTPAIRDFFDIWYVKNHSDFDFSENDFLKLVDTKLAEVDYDYTTDTQEKYDLLEKQITTDLIPVLHQNYDFSLREIYDFILQFKK